MKFVRRMFGSDRVIMYVARISRYAVSALCLFAALRRLRRIRLGSALRLVAFAILCRSRDLVSVIRRLSARAFGIAPPRDRNRNRNRNRSPCCHVF